MLKILCFGIATDIIGEYQIEWALTNGLTVGLMKKQLLEKYEGFEDIFSYAIAVNESYAEDDVPLNSGDIVAIIPPVSGG